jgi:hypothetical protein
MSGELNTNLIIFGVIGLCVGGIWVLTKAQFTDGKSADEMTSYEWINARDQGMISDQSGGKRHKTRSVKQNKTKQNKTKQNKKGKTTKTF